MVTTKEMESAEEVSNGSNSASYSLANKAFYAEWEDVFMFPLDFPLRLPLRMLGPVHRWREADWTVLFLARSQKEFGVFIGYEDPSKLPQNWYTNLLFQFALLNHDGKEICSSIVSRNGFNRPNGVTERVDHGNWNAFPTATVLKHLQALNAAGLGRRITTAGGGVVVEVPVRIGFRCELVFNPVTIAQLPSPYNSKRMTGMVGLENLGATCYLNALLQMLYHINDFRRAVYKLPHSAESLSTSTTLALQHLFKNLQYSDKEASPKELIGAFGWSSADAFLQQDVQEMLRILIDKLEEKMRGTVVEDYTKRLFAGKSRSYIRCVNVQYESKRVEDFYDIQLDVKGCRNIYESFKKYTEIEMLDGENQYEAGDHGKQDAQKGVTFEQFPPVLTIHLKRFDFDLNTFHFYKINDYYEFPERLELDQFLAEDCPAEARRTPNVYLLHSVLVHMGDAGSGHYYAYIRPATANFRYGAAAATTTSAATAATNTSATAAPTVAKYASYDEAADAGADFTKPMIIECENSGCVMPGAVAAENFDMDIMNDEMFGPRNLLSSLQESVTSAKAATATVGANGNSGPDDQWFKFNDEIVHKVTQREAIDHCYGRRILEDTYRSIASAYMLVYIREADAAQIMSAVQPSEIPRSLFDRFENEVSVQRAAEMREKRNKYFVPVMFATESELRCFDEYTRVQDFINERFMRRLDVMAGSSRLGLHLAIAKELKVSPNNMRLWEIDKRGSAIVVGHKRPTPTSTLRVTEEYSPSELKYELKHNKFYVQLFNTGLNAKEARNFAAMYEEFLREEEVLLNNLREKLFEVPHMYYTEHDDPVYGCGIGSGNCPLLDLKEYDSNAFESFNKEFERLKVSLISQLEEFTDTLNPKDSVLVFIKVFDPLNLLPQLSVHNDSSNGAGNLTASTATAAALTTMGGSEEDDELEEEEIVAGYPFAWEQQQLSAGIKQELTGDLRSADTSAAAESKEEGSAPLCEEKMDICHADATAAAGKTSRAFSSSSKRQSKAAPYVPVKYLGSIVLTPTESLKSLGDEVKDLLDKYGRQFTPRARSVAAGYDSEDEENPYTDEYDPEDHFSMHISESPMLLLPIAATNTTSGGRLTVNSCLQDSGHVVYVDISKLPRGETLRLPIRESENRPALEYSDPASWLRYQAMKKCVSVRPLSQRDAIALKKLYRSVDLHNAKLLQQREDVGRFNLSRSNSISSTHSNPKSYNSTRRKRSKSAELATALTTASSEHASSTAATGAVADEELCLLDPPPKVRKSFDIEVTTSMSMLLVFTRIADELRVCADHLALYLVEDTSNTEEMLTGAMQSRPLTLLNDRSYSVQEVISQLQLHTKPSTCYGIFFKLLPYAYCVPDAARQANNVMHLYRHVSNPNPIANSTEQYSVDQMATFVRDRYRDFNICDERLRRWRNEFRKHLQKTDPLYSAEPVDVAMARLSAAAAATAIGSATTAVADPVRSTAAAAAGEVTTTTSAGDAMLTDGVAADASTNTNGIVGSKRRKFATDEQKRALRQHAAVAVVGAEAAAVAAAAPGGLAIDWPSSADIPILDVLETNVVYAFVPASVLACDMCDMLRRLIGIPNNIAELAAAAVDADAILTPSPAAAAELLADESLLQTLSAVHYAVVTDHFRWTNSAATAAASEVASDGSSRALQPAFPLMISCMRNRNINEILCGNSILTHMLQCWSECNGELRNLFTMGLQLVTAEEALLRMGRHPSVKSMIVVVTNFTAFGNAVQLCEERLFSGPFVSHVREDDDYYSLTQRFGVITGDADCDKYRLAVMDQTGRIPTFIPRPANPTVDATATAGAKPNSIWSLLVSKNPLFVNPALTNFTNPDFRTNKFNYPHISIQRSAADLPSNNRFKRYGNPGAIKIV